MSSALSYKPQGSIVYAYPHVEVKLSTIQTDKGLRTINIEAITQWCVPL